MFPFTRKHNVTLKGLTEHDLPDLIAQLQIQSEKLLCKDKIHSEFIVDNNNLKHLIHDETFKYSTKENRNAVLRSHTEYAFHPTLDGVDVELTRHLSKIAIFFMSLALIIAMTSTWWVWDAGLYDIIWVNITLTFTIILQSLSGWHNSGQISIKLLQNAAQAVRREHQ